MGIDRNGLKLLLYAKKKIGVDFSLTATIGRQEVHFKTKHLINALKSFKFQYKQSDIKEIINNKYAEFLFHYLGANKIDSFDCSDYESATFVQDFNLAIPDTFKEKYSAVIDGGSLEHIFNFPVAIKNCMEMIKPEGYFIAITPANNFMGHGFYQFSPELYYNIFQQTNGFEIKDVIIFSINSKRFYHVKDPQKLRRRVNLINKTPTYLFIVAKKKSTKPIFNLTPQQSDYLIQWENSCSVRKNNPPNYLKSKVFKFLYWLKLKIFPFNPSVFERIKIK
jgi:hypothetical protein